MFDKILIANRGEIACRVVKTCRALGIRTVAVYSSADRNALHVALADEAYHIGPPAPRESYLRGDRILDAAKKSGAQAIHPGYGFLSENADFAEACTKAGVVFIGPPPAAIRAMGSKTAAKALMEQAGVPVVPGYHGENQDPAFLQETAAEIGFPVLIKAAAGGGGKGMKRVDSEETFAAALASAKREAASAFGDDKVLIERYLLRPRHIEMQVFADVQGNTFYLFERDCSIQRRHQKVIEEAPAPKLSVEKRCLMGNAAVAAAKAVGYINAGTVEFIVDQEETFCFMEMNTRLQVEHPVTEMISGLDLVEWQIRVASGETLPWTQEGLHLNGHAIEARVYAEDPRRDFLPAPGTLRYYSAPRESQHVRVDSGVREGDHIGHLYDPMIAKLIVWDTSRPAAIRRLQTALASYRIAGLTTNLPFLSAIAGHPAFLAGVIDTSFISDHHEDLIPVQGKAPDKILALAALDLVLRQTEAAQEIARKSSDPYSPWHWATGWRLNEDYRHTFRFLDGTEEAPVTVHFGPDAFRFDLPGGTVQVQGGLEEDGSLSANIGGVRTTATVVHLGRELTVVSQGATYRLMLHDPLAAEEEEEATGGTIMAPMPGKIAAVMVEEGAAVKAGTPLMVLEAMKIEHVIAASFEGVVRKLHVRGGDQVAEGAPLVDLDPKEVM